MARKKAPPKIGEASTFASGENIPEPAKVKKKKDVKKEVVKDDDVEVTPPSNTVPPPIPPETPETPPAKEPPAKVEVQEEEEEIFTPKDLIYALEEETKEKVISHRIFKEKGEFAYIIMVTDKAKKYKAFPTGSYDELHTLESMYIEPNTQTGKMCSKKKDKE